MSRSGGDALRQPYAVAAAAVADLDNFIAGMDKKIAKDASIVFLVLDHGAWNCGAAIDSAARRRGDRMIKRRTFIAGLGSAPVWPTAVAPGIATKCRPVRRSGGPDVSSYPINHRRPAGGGYSTVTFWPST